MSIPKIDRNAVQIVGELTGDTQSRSYDGGAHLLSFSVRTRLRSDEGAVTETVPVAWWNPPLSSDDLESGRRVRVTGRVHRRFYRSATGTRSAVEVVADAVEVQE